QYEIIERITNAMVVLASFQENYINHNRGRLFDDVRAGGHLSDAKRKRPTKRTEIGQGQSLLKLTVFCQQLHLLISRRQYSFAEGRRHMLEIKSALTLNCSIISCQKSGEPRTGFGR